MQFWLSTIVIFFVQETAFITSRIVVLYGQGVNPWLLHFLFIFATTCDIFIGFAIGQYLHKRFLHGSRFELWVKKEAKFLKQHHWGYLLTLSGVVNFPYVNAILGSWMDLPFWRVFVATLIGDSVSYALYWGFALGIVHLSINIYLGIAIALTALLFLMALLRKYIFRARFQ